MDSDGWTERQTERQQSKWSLYSHIVMTKLNSNTGVLIKIKESFKTSYTYFDFNNGNTSYRTIYNNSIDDFWSKESNVILCLFQPRKHKIQWQECTNNRHLYWQNTNKEIKIQWTQTLKVHHHNLAQMSTSSHRHIAHNQRKSRTFTQKRLKHASHCDGSWIRKWQEFCRVIP